MHLHTSAAALILFTGQFLAAYVFAEEHRPHGVAAADSTKKPGASLHIIAKGNADSVLLRWAPASLASWQRWKKAGCLLQRRAIIAASGRSAGEWEQLTRRAIKPWSLATVASRSDGSNFWIGAAMSAVYIERLNLPGSGDERHAPPDEQGAVTLALLAADRDAAAAQALGLRFVDITVSKGEMYEYRIMIAADARPGDTSVVKCRAADEGMDPAPAQLTAEGGDGRVMLRWMDFAPNQYGFFHVFRSDDDGRTYICITPEAPVASDMTDGGGGSSAALFIDTAVVNGRVYRYRVRGLTPFAELGEAAEIAASPRDLTPPPAPSLRNPEYSGGNEVVLAWIYQEGSGGDLAGFRVNRCATENGEYKILNRSLLPASTREFVDKTPDEKETFYTVSSVDKAGNEAASWPKQLVVVDSIPPSTPTGLKAYMDTLGVVRIEWNPNPEADVFGYQLFRSFNPGGEMLLMTPRFRKENNFIDTVDIAAGAGRVYYDLLALDKNGNMSGTCGRISLPIPDLVPPLRPVFTGADVVDSGITLTWTASPDEDIEAQLLYRLDGETGKAGFYRSFPPSMTSFTDTSFTAGAVYRYELLAMDKYGNSSARDAIRAALPRSSKLPAVLNLQARYDKEKKVVTLAWDRPAGIEGDYWFVLFRASEGEPLRMYRSIVPRSLEFVDDDLTDASIHTYSISVMNSNGAESPPSVPVKVETLDAPH